MSLVQHEHSLAHGSGVYGRRERARRWLGGAELAYGEGDVYFPAAR